MPLIIREADDTSSDDTAQRFLLELFEKTKGDPSVQLSMFDIGDAVKLDRDTARKTAEQLMGTGLVEIRTLSGGIGLSPAGIERALALGGGGSVTKTARLGNDSVLSPNLLEAVDLLVAELKLQAGNFSLDFDALCEFTADINTISSQLASPQPKTAIVRAVLQSIRIGLESTGSPEIRARLDRFLGN